MSHPRELAEMDSQISTEGTEAAVCSQLPPLVGMCRWVREKEREVHFCVGKTKIPLSQTGNREREMLGVINHCLLSQNMGKCLSRKVPKS